MNRNIAPTAPVSLMFALLCMPGGCGKPAAATADSAFVVAAPHDDRVRQNANPDSADFERYSSAQLAQIADVLARAGSTGRTFGGHASFHYVESRRDRSGTPEIHDRWVDLTIVQSGRATMLTGGHVKGGDVVSSGEHRGGTIVGGDSRPVAAGDFFVVPAGVPHQFQIAAGDSIRYLTIKVAR
jgi:mannose-6-phosphate isomerase-like protein (cupin superfamily)